MVTELRNIGCIKKYNTVSIEVKLIQNDQQRELYDIRKYKEGEHQFRGISLEEDVAKELFVLLGKEFEVFDEEDTFDSVQEKMTRAKITKRPFLITPEQIEEITISEEPISAKNFVKIINTTIDKTQMKALSITSINKWLLSNGYISEEKVPINKVVNTTVRKLTETSKNFGLLEHEVLNQSTGEITTEIQLSDRAQQSILEHINEISGLTK